MANECTFSACITGRSANVRAFLKTMEEKWAYEVSYEDDPPLETFPPSRIIHVYVEGFCKWSVLCAMRGRKPSIESESKRLNLIVEIYSSEPGCAFQEHVLVNKGGVCIDDCVDYTEIYVGDYDSIEEYNADNDTIFTEDMVEDGYIILGGFGDEYNDFHSIEDFMEEEPDLALEMDDLIEHTPDLSKIIVDTNVFDEFEEDMYITIRFAEKNDEIYLYKMIEEENAGITMELIYKKEI